MVVQVCGQYGILLKRVETFFPYLSPPAVLQSSIPRWNFNFLKKKKFPQRRENGTFNTPDEAVHELITE